MVENPNPHATHLGCFKFAYQTYVYSIVWVCFLILSVDLYTPTLRISTDFIGYIALLNHIVSNGRINGEWFLIVSLVNTEYIWFQTESVNASTLNRAQLLEAVRKQVEYYFSKENLQSDVYLTSQMDAQMTVPISVVMKVRTITLYY